MNTLRKIAMVAMTLVLSTAITFAAPSKENNGSSYSLTEAQSDTFVSKYEDATVALNFDKWVGVPADEVTKIDAFNAGSLSLSELMDGVDVSGYAALSSCDDVVMYNTAGDQVAGGNVKVTFKNAAINSTLAGKTLAVGHFNTTTQKWELIAASNVNTAANTAEVTMPNLSPVVLIYTASASSSNVPNTGLYTNPAYLAVAAAGLLTAVALVSKKKRA